MNHYFNSNDLCNKPARKPITNNLSWLDAALIWKCRERQSASGSHPIAAAFLASMAMVYDDSPNNDPLLYLPGFLPLTEISTAVGLQYSNF